MDFEDCMVPLKGGISGARANRVRVCHRVYVIVAIDCLLGVMRNA